MDGEDDYFSAAREEEGGLKMATIKDIADKLGISIGTVSKGLNGASDISDALRQTVLDTAVEMGYTTKKMKKEEHKKLCIFIENMEYETSNQFGYEIILGFKQAAYRDKWDVVVLPIDPAFQMEEKYDTFMLKNGYSGAFLVGFTLQDNWMEQLNATAIPTVLFDNYIKKNPNVAYVGTDSFEGIDSAIDRLVMLGHERIAFFNGSPNSMVSDQRLQAYRDSLTFHHLEYNEKLTAYSYYIAENAKHHVPTFLAEGATAILCSNDYLASGVMAECKMRGLRVPEDVSVIGFDDLPISAHLDPPLTTIRQDRIELGKCGYFALNCLINHVSISRTMLRAQYIERASTAVPKDI